MQFVQYTNAVLTSAHKGAWNSFRLSVCLHQVALFHHSLAADTLNALQGMDHAANSRQTQSGALQDLVRQIAAGGAMLALGHRMFKLEDVAMGAWVEWVANAKGWPVAYVGDVRFNFHGCTPTDIVSHYINPEQTLCMYKSSTPICCSKHGRHHSRT